VKDDNVVNAEHASNDNFVNCLIKGVSVISSRHSVKQFKLTPSILKGATGKQVDWAQDFARGAGYVAATILYRGRRKLRWRSTQ